MIDPADLSFLSPLLQAARQEHEGGGAATTGRAEGRSTVFGASPVAVAPDEGAHFEPSMLSKKMRRRWPLHDGDQSKRDFAVAADLARQGWSPSTMAAAIRARRQLLRKPVDGAKGMRADYVGRTVQSAFLKAAPKQQGKLPPPYVPFPVETLPDLIRDFVVLAGGAMCCAVEAVALPLLAGLCAAIGNTRCIQVKPGWSEPALLWIAVVMSSGKLKSPAQDCALNTLRARQVDALRKHRQEMKQYEQDMLRHGRRLKKWERDGDGVDPPPPPERPSAIRYIVSDITLEALAPILEENPRGLLLEQDEIGAWFLSFNSYRGGRGGDLQQWLSIFGARALLVDRKKNRETCSVERAAVSIFGGIQPKTLMRVLTREFFECGLPARFLLAMPDAPRKRWSERRIPGKTQAATDRAFGRLLTLKPEPCEDGAQSRFLPSVMPFTREAQAIWADRYDEFAHQQEQLSPDDDLGAAFAKLEGYTARLALILELAAWACGEEQEPPDRVGPTSLQGAIALVRWFARETERIYSALAEGRKDSYERELIDWIRCRGGEVSVRDLQRGPRRYRGSAQMAERRLQDLIRSGHGWWHSAPPPPNGGQPTKVFELRPENTAAGDGDTRAEVEPVHLPSEDRLSPGTGETS